MAASVIESLWSTESRILVILVILVCFDEALQEIFPMKQFLGKVF